MDSTTFLVLVLFVIAYAAVSGRLRESLVTPTMVFVAFGLLIGEAGTGVLTVDVRSPVVLTLLEATLVLVLFTDAARIDLGRLRREFRLPLRLLLVGMPVMMVVGTLVGMLLLPGLSWWEVALAAVILAPTDAALGQVVVTSPRVPVRIRQTLNVESGLNDGLALPALAVAVALAGMSQATQSVGYWVALAARQLGYGVAVGVAAGYLGGRLIALGTRTRWMSKVFQKIAAVAVALLAFSVTQQLGGSGFIAAFVAGLTIGNLARPVCDCLYDFAETEGQLLTLLAFLVFGAGAVAPALQGVTWPVVMYAVLSLTAIRLVSVGAGLAGSGLRTPTVLFIGWFGPRGIASILFGLLVLEESGLSASEPIFQVVTVTVLISVFAHGLTARPGATRYAAWVESGRRDAAEMMPAVELPLRVPGGS